MKKIDTFTRICSCGHTATYRNIISYNRACKYDTKCKKCTALENMSKFREDVSAGIRSEPFAGKRHTEKSIQRMRDNHFDNTKHINYLNRDMPKGDTHHFTGKNNSEYMLHVWTEKFGEAEANKRRAEYLLKKSKAAAGKNNPMYGKPSPKNSGNGWGGWYMGIYFRSLLELSTMCMLDRFRFAWKIAESAEFMIQYEMDGNTYNYFPDFFVNGFYLVECKPRRLWNSKQVMAKKTCAERWCAERGLKYKMMDVPKLDMSSLLRMIEHGAVVPNNRMKLKLAGYI